MRLSSLLRVAFVAAGVSLLAAASLPDPVTDIDPSAVKGKQTAVFAGGCFWCTEAVFDQLAGVESVVSGYAGGNKEQAHYELVGSGHTGHAESIQITFHPDKISYGQLLKVFFSVAHDPTQKDRQGPDWGRQYRSAIFFNSAEQKRVAEAYIQQLEQAHAFSKPIVTEVSALPAFFPAEAYHQDFVKRNPAHPYVVVNALPKLQKAKKEFPNLLKK